MRCIAGITRTRSVVTTLTVALITKQHQCSSQSLSTTCANFSHHVQQPPPMERPRPTPTGNAVAATQHSGAEKTDDAGTSSSSSSFPQHLSQTERKRSFPQSTPPQSPSAPPGTGTSLVSPCSISHHPPPAADDVRAWIPGGGFCVACKVAVEGHRVATHIVGRNHQTAVSRVQLLWSQHARAEGASEPPKGVHLNAGHIWCRFCQTQIDLWADGWARHIGGSKHKKKRKKTVHHQQQQQQQVQVQEAKVMNAPPSDDANRSIINHPVQSGGKKVITRARLKIG